jgi:hypothetical protein
MITITIPDVKVSTTRGPDYDEPEGWVCCEALRHRGMAPTYEEALSLLREGLNNDGVTIEGE